MMMIDFNNYFQIKNHIIRFLTKYSAMKYCYPIGSTLNAIRSGIDPQELEHKSVKLLKKSKKIKYKPYSHLRRFGGSRILVYVFLIMDCSPVMYSKYAVNMLTHEVFWLGLHPSSNPHDRNFHNL